MCIEWSVQRYDDLDSTQSYIKTLNLHEGLLVTAKRQGAGVGRHGRSWTEGQGNLYFSFVLQPECAFNQIGHLTMLISVALHRVISAYTDHVVIKWPNDVLIQKKKCAGILIDIHDSDDSTVKTMIIGIGVNVGCAPLPIASYINELASSAVSSDEVLQCFQSRFSDLYAHWKARGIDDIYDEYCQYHLPVGSDISVKTGSRIIKGTLAGIDLSGNLRLIDNENTQERLITSGDVIDY